MRRRKVVLRSVGGLLAVLLGLWLASSLLSRTVLEVDPDARRATAQTAVGRLECRKTLTPGFPFVALTCKEDR